MTSQPGKESAHQQTTSTPDLTYIKAYAIEVGPCAVLLATPTAIRDVLDALEGALRAGRSNGYPMVPRVVELCAVLRRHLVAYNATVIAAVGNAAMPSGPELTSWERVESVTSAEAAKLLGLQPRQVRNLVRTKRLPARKFGGTWQIDVVAVTEAARERRGAA